MAGWYNLLVVFAVSIGSMTYGMSYSAISGVIGLPGFLHYYDVATTGPNAAYGNTIQGAINGVFFGSGFFGCFGFAWLADKIGRRASLQVVVVLCIIAAIIQTASVHVGMLLAGRALHGIAGGGLNVICPMFQSEVSRASHRGKMVGLHGMMTIGGVSLANYFALGCYFLSNQSAAWRILLGSQALPALVLLPVTFYLPESPRWLVSKDRIEEAREVLRRLHPSNKDTPSTFTTAAHHNDEDVAEMELEQIIGQSKIDVSRTVGYVSLFKSPHTRRRLAIGMFLMYAQQSSGHNVLFGYQVNLLNGLGVTGWKPLVVLCAYTTWAAFLNFVGGVLMDIWGRRKMLIGGFTGAGLAVAVYTALCVEYVGSSNRAGASAGIATLFIFITIFAPGVDVTSYVYSAEIFPTFMRAQGVAASTAMYFMFGALYIGIAPTATGAIGGKYTILFVCLTAINVVVIYFTFPETKGLTLEEMGKLFGDAVASNEVSIEAVDETKKGVTTGATVMVVPV